MKTGFKKQTLRYRGLYRLYKYRREKQHERGKFQSTGKRLTTDEIEEQELQ